MSEINCNNCAISDFKESLCQRCDKMKRIGNADDIEKLIIGCLPSEQPEQRWIPCGEKYPEPDDRVLVITDTFDYYVWDCMSGREDNYFWEDESGYYHNKDEVIAWMPLPEAYKGEQE